MSELLPLTRHTWHQAAKLQVAEEQADYLPSNLESIAQAYFEESELFGIYDGGTMVGFVSICYFSGIPWIARFMIGAAFQGQGHGKTALDRLLKRLLSKPGVQEVRTSVAKGNAEAEYLFKEAGFRRSGEVDDLEFVMVYRP